jgi:hypothetical protein
MSYLFSPKGRGNLRIWKNPEPDNYYSIGADTAEGLVSGDFTCAEVFDKKNYEQVAEWHGKCPPDLFAFELKKLGEFYNNAKVVVESNNHGLVTLTYLKPIYYNLYYRREFDKRDNKATRQMGFRTTGKSKPILIDDFNKLFRENELIINGRELLTEMSTYEEDENGGMNAMHNCNDDRVIAACLSIHGLKEIVIIENIPIRYGKYRSSNPITGY